MTTICLDCAQLFTNGDAVLAHRDGFCESIEQQTRFGDDPERGHTWFVADNRELVFDGVEWAVRDQTGLVWFDGTGDEAVLCVREPDGTVTRITGALYDFMQRPFVTPIADQIIDAFDQVTDLADDEEGEA